MFQNIDIRKLSEMAGPERIPSPVCQRPETSPRSCVTEAGPQTSVRFCSARRPVMRLWHLRAAQNRKRSVFQRSARILTGRANLPRNEAMDKGPPGVVIASGDNPRTSQKTLRLRFCSARRPVLVCPGLGGMQSDTLYSLPFSRV